MNHPSTDEIRFRPVGALDALAGRDLRWQAEQAVQDGARRMRIDLSEVDFMDSAGLGTLVALTKLARRSDLDLVIHDVSSPVQQLIRMTRLDRFLPIA
jgi:anti-sigma B factor antagonist